MGNTSKSACMGNLILIDAHLLQPWLATETLFTLCILQYAMHFTIRISLTSETTLKSMNVGVIPLKVSRYIQLVARYTTYL